MCAHIQNEMFTETETETKSINVHLRCSRNISVHLRCSTNYLLTMSQVFERVKLFIYVRKNLEIKEAFT